MNRRSFLQLAGASAATLALSSCVHPGLRPNEKMHLAAIGCGRMGRTDIEGLLGIAAKYNAIFVAVCDVDSNRMRDTKAFIEAFYQEQGIVQPIKTYSNHQALLADRSIDAVSIVVSDHAHAHIAIDAANARKDIYLEKPLTYTIDQGKELVKAVKKNRVILQTGTQQRSSVYFRRVSAIARNGLLGDIKRIEVAIPMDKGQATFSNDAIPSTFNYQAWLADAPHRPYCELGVHPQDSLKRPGWMQVSDFSHGMITNWGAHMLDIAQWGNGTDLSGPVELEASATFEDRGVFDVHRKFSASNRYANGVELTLRTIEPGEQIAAGVKFIGSKGWASCWRGGFNANDREILRWEPGENDIQLEVSSNHHDNFLSCVRSRKQPITNAEIGHRSNSVCVLNLISAKLGQSLTWNPEKERFVGNDRANAMLKDMRA